MKRHRTHRSGPDNSEFADGGLSRKVLVALLVALPMLATIGYGATDMWAFMPLALLTALIIVLWTAVGLKQGSILLSSSPLQLPLVALILLGLIQLLPLGGTVESGLLAMPAVSTLSLDPYSTRFFTIRLVLLLVFFSASLTFLGGKTALKRTAVAVVIFGALMAFAGILQRLASPDAIYGMRLTPQAIPFGPFVNQHHFAAFMEMTGGVTLGLLLGDVVERNKKGLLLIALILMFIAVSMTGSRGGMISTLGVAAFGLFAHFYLGRRKEPATDGRSFGLRAAAVAAVVLMVAAVSVLLLSGADPLARGLGIQSGQADVTSGRTHFWWVALKIFSDNPIIGAGFDAFGVAFSRYDTWNGLFRVEQAHNDYLQTLADGGLLAFACVLAFIFLFLKRALAVIKTSTSPSRRSIAVGAMAGCIGILIHSFLDFPLRTPSNAFFFLLLVTMATVPLGDERNSPKVTD